MDPKRVTRKLRAILSADVQGYSRLMGDDEVATFKKITEYREIFSSIVTQYNGRVVDSPGDNILSEFASVVDAVQCAVEIQKVLKAKNEELPENRRMIFRIGVNLGDVIHEDDRIYGDGVNIAARIESLADGGGICISGTAYDQIENKLALGYNFIGDHSVKNIAKPIRVYKVPMVPGDVVEKVKPKLAKKAAIAVAVVIILVAAAIVWNSYFRTERTEPANLEKMAFSLPDKPSIAVLPFDNMSGDPKQDYIADGISENIISALSKISEIFVIARNSTFTYKNKAVKVQKVAEDLGVRYVLEGSVLESGNKIRITVQLIDAITGYHIWSEKYDRKMEDFFQLLDEITYKIVVALQVKLTHGEQVRKWYGTTNFEAWSEIARGFGIFENYSKANNEKARELFENAIKIDPDCAFAWVMLGWTHFIDVRFAFTKTPAVSLKKALQDAKKAQSIDDTLSDVPALLGSIYLVQRQYDKAITEGQKAIELGPNNALSHVLFAQILYYSGNPERAIALGEQAQRLCPNCPAWYSIALGKSYRTAGRYEDAIRVFNEVLERAQKGEFPLWFANSNLAIAYAMNGQDEDARIHLAEAIKLNPAYSFELEGKLNFYKDSNQLEAIFDALRKAGMADTTSPAVADKPTIAVLPFDNFSKDKNQDYFSDGMSEDLITDLSKISDLFVKSRKSSFVFKGKKLSAREIGEKLKVRYILEGSVRKAGNRIRINAQLIDTKSGHHLWAERYDENISDIFDIQDKITKKIVTALALKLSPSEENKIAHKGTDNIAAYDAVLKGRANKALATSEGYSRAISFFEKAIKLDPNYGEAYANLASVYNQLAVMGIPEKQLGMSLKEIRLKEREVLEAALKKNPTAITHAMNGVRLLFQYRPDEANAEAERALALDSNNPDVLWQAAASIGASGRSAMEIDLAKKALRLDPNCLF